MAVRIRLQRHGKKGQPFYHVVIADGRAPRDGKFIEKIGTYNPMTNPATIELNVDSACEWLKKGAQPSDTARSILSHKGVMMKRHLQIGVEKGAITQEQADAKFNAWVADKESKLLQRRQETVAKKSEAEKQRFALETKIKEDRAQALAKKRAEEEKKNSASTEEAAPVAEEAAPVVEEAAPVAEEAAPVAEEAAPASEEATETPAE